MYEGMRRGAYGIWHNGSKYKVGLLGLAGSLRSALSFINIYNYYIARKLPKPKQNCIYVAHMSITLRIKHHMTPNAIEN
jgi:hypothetical protein